MVGRKHHKEWKAQWKFPRDIHFQYILDRWMDDLLVGGDTKHEIYEALASFNK